MSTGNTRCAPVPSAGFLDQVHQEQTELTAMTRARASWTHSPALASTTGIPRARGMPEVLDLDWRQQPGAETLAT